MIWVYNACRAAARTLTAGAAGLFFSVFFNGKAEAFGVHFDGETAFRLLAGLLFAVYVSFCAESWAKKRAGL